METYKQQLAQKLVVTEEVFHREIKPIIKADFIEEINQYVHANNPDIWLDDFDNIVLVNPTNEKDLYYTYLPLLSYK